MRRVGLFLLDYVVSEDKRKARKRPTRARVPDRPPVCAVGTLPSPLAIHESMSTGKYVAHILGNKRAQRLSNALSRGVGDPRGDPPPAGHRSQAPEIQGLRASLAIHRGFSPIHMAASVEASSTFPM